MFNIAQLPSELLAVYLETYPINSDLQLEKGNSSSGDIILKLFGTDEKTKKEHKALYLRVGCYNFNNIILLNKLKIQIEQDPGMLGI